MTEAAGGGPVLELDKITRVYKQGDHRLEIFKNLDFALHAGEISALVGESGSGKSSLLHIAGLLEAPTSGEVKVAGRNCTALDDTARTKIRRYAIGFVYQFHHLLPEFTALENVMMPQLIAGETKGNAIARARKLLDQLGLSPRAGHLPAEMSGGEQQRVAIARALANRPLVLLADEPTGNLDPKTSKAVHDQFLEMIASEGLAALIATHNHQLANTLHHVYSLKDGIMQRTGGTRTP